MVELDQAATSNKRREAKKEEEQSHSEANRQHSTWGACRCETSRNKLLVSQARSQEFRVLLIGHSVRISGIIIVRIP